MKRREISTTGDYVSDGSGGISSVEHMVPSVLLAISTTRGSVPSAPTFGRRPRVGAVTALGARVEEKALRDALEHLVLGGLIWDLAVTCDVAGDRYATEIAFTDGSGEQRIIR